MSGTVDQHPKDSVEAIDEDNAPVRHPGDSVETVDEHEDGTLPTTERRGDRRGEESASI